MGRETRRRAPRKSTDKVLAASGIKMVNEGHFECLECGATWSPNIQPGGKLPRRWWVCPNGCNDPRKA